MAVVSSNSVRIFPKMANHCFNRGMNVSAVFHCNADCWVTKEDCICLQQVRVCVCVNYFDLESQKNDVPRGKAAPDSYLNGFAEDDVFYWKRWLILM